VNQWDILQNKKEKKNPQGWKPVRQFFNTYWDASERLNVGKPEKEQMHHKVTVNRSSDHLVYRESF